MVKAWPAGPTPVTSTIGNERSDRAFLELLKRETSGATRKAAPEQAAKANLTEGQIRKMKLKESDVAKVTREGISHLQFHPTSSDLVIATGDKQGHIALWDVDKKTSHEVHPLLHHKHCTSHGENACDALRLVPLQSPRPTVVSAEHTQHAKHLKATQRRLANLTMQAAGEDDDVEDSGAEDGVYLFRPHTSYISGLR